MLKGADRMVAARAAASPSPSEALGELPAIRFVDMVMNMLDRILRKGGAVDKVHACRLAQHMLLRLRGRIDDLLPRLLSLLCTNMMQESDSHLLGKLVSTVALCFAYNARFTTQILAQGGGDAPVALWLKKLDENVHAVEFMVDKKVLSLGMMALLAAPADAVPTLVKVRRDALFARWARGPGTAAPRRASR